MKKLNSSNTPKKRMTVKDHIAEKKRKEIEQVIVGQHMIELLGKGYDFDFTPD